MEAGANTGERYESVGSWPFIDYELHRNDVENSQFFFFFAQHVLHCSSIYRKQFNMLLGQ